MGIYWALSIGYFPPMDSLSLRNIRVNTRIGVPQEERKTLQEILVSIEFLHPIGAVATVDDPASGIDYAAAVRLIEGIASTERKTIERFAEDVADTLLKQFKPDGGVRVTVEKRPPLPLESASVTIHRRP